MPIKTRRYRKRNNKSCRTRKNKTTRRYKKQMKGGNGLIKNEEELKKSWENRARVGDRRYIYSEDLTYDQFKEKINYYLKQVEKGQKDAYIKIIYK
jgi:hypothetical protein